MDALSGIKVISELTKYQWGLFTFAQALVKGVSRMNISRLLQHGHIEKIRHGVYKEIGSPDDKDMYVKALWLSFIPKKTVAERLKNLVDDFILIGEEAANLYGIGDYYTSEYEFYHNKRKQISDKNVIIRIKTLDLQNITILNGLPVVRTPFLLNDMINRNFEPSNLQKAIDNALKNGLLTDKEFSDLSTVLRKKYE